MKTLTPKFHLVSLILVVMLSVLCFNSKNIARACEFDVANTSAHVKETLWYNDQRMLIEDENIIHQLNGLQSNNERGAFCCGPDTMHKIIVYSEEHTISGTGPAWCVYDRFKLVVCDYRLAVWSRTYVGQFQHIHP